MSISNSKRYSIIKKNLKGYIKNNKFITHLMQETFRTELSSKEYSCFSDQQKEEIMKLLKITTWDLPYIRSVFQNEIIQKNINKLIFIFNIMDSEVIGLKYLSWDLMRTLLNNLDKNIDFDIAVDMLQIFSTSNMDGDYIKFYNHNRRLIDDNITQSYLNPTEKLRLFESAINSSSVGCEIGSKLYDIYTFCKKIALDMSQKDDDFIEFFGLIEKAYAGYFDDYPEIIESIQEYYLKIIKCVDFDFVISDMFNLLKILNQKVKEVQIQTENSQISAKAAN